jgi:hypothetical protein
MKLEWPLASMLAKKLVWLLALQLAWLLAMYLTFRGGVGCTAGMAQVGIGVGVAVHSITAEVGIAVGVAVGIMTEFIYSILHGPKSCYIKYRQWWALQLIKSHIS